MRSYGESIGWGSGGRERERERERRTGFRGAAAVLWSGGASEVRSCAFKLPTFFALFVSTRVAAEAVLHKCWCNPNPNRHNPNIVLLALLIFLHHLSSHFRERHPVS